MDDVTLSHNGAYGIQDRAYVDNRVWFSLTATEVKSAILDCPVLKLNLYDAYECFLVYIRVYKIKRGQCEIEW